MNCRSMLYLTLVMGGGEASLAGAAKPETVVTTAIRQFHEGARQSETDTIQYWRSADKARIDRSVKRGDEEGVERTIEILTPEWTYILDESAKTGQKHRAGTYSSAPLDYQLHRYDPVWWAREMTARGKRAFSERVDGTACDVYESPYHKLQKGWRILVWVRKDTGMAVKEERRKPDGKADLTLAYQKVQVGVPVEGSLFRIPRGYRVLERGK